MPRPSTPPRLPSIREEDGIEDHLTDETRSHNPKAGGTKEMIIGYMLTPAKRRSRSRQGQPIPPTPTRHHSQKPAKARITAARPCKEEAIEDFFTRLIGLHSCFDLLNQRVQIEKLNEEIRRLAISGTFPEPKWLYGWVKDEQHEAVSRKSQTNMFTYLRLVAGNWDP